MNHDLLVIGSTCVDVIIRVDHLPRTEENLHPDSHVRYAGRRTRRVWRLCRGTACEAPVCKTGLAAEQGERLLLLFG